MPRQHQEHSRSTSIRAPSRRQQLEAARARRYRQRQKAKRPEAVNGTVPPRSLRRLQPGERVMTFASTELRGWATSSSGGLGSPNASETYGLTDQADVVRQLQRVLRARQRQLWITFGRILSYLGYPVGPTPRCFIGRRDFGQDYMDNQGPLNRSDTAPVVRIWAQDDNDNRRWNTDHQGQLHGLSVLAQAAAVAAGEEDGRVGGVGKAENENGSRAEGESGGNGHVISNLAPTFPFSAGGGATKESRKGRV